MLRGTRLLLGRAHLLPLQRRLQLLLRLLQGRQLLAVLPRHLQLGIQLGGGLQATTRSRNSSRTKDGWAIGGCFTSRASSRSVMVVVSSSSDAANAKRST